MATFVNSSSAQAWAGFGHPTTTLATPAYALTADNLSVVVVRASSTDPSLYGISDTAGNSYTRDGVVGIGHGLGFVVWSCPNCLGHAANIVTVTYPSQDFTAVTAIQFSGAPLTSPLDSFTSAYLATGATVSCLPNGLSPNQIVIVASDVGTGGFPAFAPSSTFTALFSSSDPPPGSGSHTVAYQLNGVRKFDGSVTVSGTYTNGGGFFPVTAPKTIFVAIYGPAESDADIGCTAEVDYEDPCVPDQEPWIAIEFLDESVSPAVSTVYHAAGVLRSINDSVAAGSAFGSRKKPCVIDFGTVRREASDPFTGNWPAQSQSLVVDDADRLWRDAREDQGGDFKMARFYQYLTSRAHRIAGGIPRLLFQGLIESDSLSEKLGFRFTVNDIIGNAYQLHTNEVMIPQRIILGANNSAGETADFPGFIDPDVRNPRAVPIVLPYTDAALSPAGGAGQAISLGDFTCADASVCVAGLISGHAQTGGVEDLFDVDGVISSFDTDIWAPGKGSDWSVKNPSGSALYTDINGHRYTLFFTNGARGDAFKDGSKPIYFNVKGPDTTADGLGTEMTDAFTLKKWLWLNHLLPTPPYLTGFWLPSPTFDFYPGGDSICRVETASFDRNSVLATLYNPGGYVWAGIIGAGGTQEPIRDVIAKMNRSSGSQTFWNEFSQISDSMLDRRRGTFVKAGILGAVPKTGIQKDPSFTVEEKPEWHCTNLHSLYANSQRLGKFIGDFQLGSSSAPFLKYGAISKEVNFDYVGDANVALALTQQLLDFMEVLPKMARWTRTWCGLTDQVGDGRAITHPLGAGQTGYTNNGFRIHAQDYIVNRGRVVNYGVDVERLLTY